MANSITIVSALSHGVFPDWSLTISSNLFPPRRPLLLNSVLLRQNPHNVAEWQKRVDLLEDKPREVVNTFTEAVQTIDPKQAVGKLSSLWVNFAKFYENNKQIEDSRIIFEKATHVAYLKVEDLASVWCEWVEMELR